MAEKILIINIHSSTNAGDAALLQVTLQQLAAVFPACQVTLSMNDPGSHTGEQRVVASISSWVHPRQADGSLKWNLLRLAWLLPATLLPVWGRGLPGRMRYLLTPSALISILDPYLGADLVISEPGGFLYSSGNGISLLLALYSIALAVMARKPVYLFPQTIGPLRHRWEKWLLRWVLQRARIVMVREPVSLKLVQGYGVCNPDLRLVPDVAFTFPAAPQPEAEAWLRAQGIDPLSERPCLGMTLLNWGVQNPRFTRQGEYEQACAAAARWFVEHTSGVVFFFPQVWEGSLHGDDRIPAQRVADQLSDLGEAVRMIQEPLPGATLKAVYGLMDIFIGTRMHSNIFALSQGVPVIAIGYLHKTRGIAEMAGISEWVIDIGEVDAQNLTSRLAALWEDRLTVGKHIQRTIPGLVGQAGAAGEMVRVDYAKLNRGPRG